MRLKLVGFVVAVSGLLAAQGAMAADMPTKMPVKAAPIQMWNWTGFYLGGYAGVGVNRSHGLDPTGLTALGEIQYVGAGFTGGATGGYNWQFAPHWVAGVEGDIGYLGLSHNIRQYNDLIFVDQKASWIATARARLGYTDGPTLSYITGGAAWIKPTDALSNVAGTASVESSKTRTGYAIGSGVETRLGGNWTAKSEFLYADVGRGDTMAVPGFALQADQHRYAMQRFGVNYLFGNTPQAPLPAGNWNGFYAGVTGGGAVTQTKVTPVLPSGLLGEFDNNGNGYTIGGLAGYNWQFAPAFVAGVEGDISWMGINKTVNDFNDPAAFYTLNTKWIATARGRVGYSTGPALLYVTGGGAWVNYNETWAFATPQVSSTKTLSGYTVGGGIETMFSLFGPGWTTRTEYLYVNVGNGDAMVSSAGTDIVANHQFHLFRSALVYHLGH